MYYNDYNRFNEAPDDSGFQSRPTTPPMPKKKRTGLRLTALCLVCALLGGAAGVGATAALNLGRRSTTLYESSRIPTAVDVAKVDGHTALTVDQVYANNVGSVVGVNGDVKTNFWGQVVSNAVAGSGFVITQDGYILTNYHVIDGVEDLKVTFSDGTSYAATLVGGEEANDIAVLKIDATGLTPVVVGNSGDMRVGEQVVAIGNPLGELTFTLTAGYVSALDRNIKMSDGNTINVMQTDAAINSGNSGGPLFNIYGECIGITNAKYSNNGSSNASIEGIGFAIPINDVIDMVTSIIEKGYVSGKPNVGILMNDVSTDAQRYGVPAGAYVEAVLEGSCGEKAGLKAGDIITAVGDTAVSSSEALKNAIKSYKAGDQVNFTVYRDGSSTTLQLTLDESNLQRSQDMEQLQKRFQESQQSQQQQQQQQQQPSGGYSWPFGDFFGW